MSILVLSLAQSWSLWNLESRRFDSHVQTRATKWRLIASLVAGHTHARQSTSNTPHQGSEPQCNGFMHRSSSQTQPRAKGQRLASPRRAKSSQHKYKDRAVILVACAHPQLSTLQNAQPFLFGHGSPKCISQPSSRSRQNILCLQGMA